MNKKLMALAVAGALAAPAAALAQNYTIYGRATLGFDQYEAKGSTVTPDVNDFKARNRVFDNGSRLGFQGAEDLGGGLRAIFLMETGVNIDTGNATNQAGGPNSSTGNWSSRVGHVGLAGGFGQVTFGRSNIWWANGAIDQVGANWLNAACQMCSGTFGRGMGVGVSRVSNVVQYTTPTFSGINFVVSISPSAEAQPNNTATDGKLFGLTAQGTHGPVAWGFDFVSNKGNTSGTLAAPIVQGETTAIKLRAGFRYMPAGQISAILVTNEVKKGGAGQVAGTGATVGGLVATCNTATTGCTLEQGGLALSWDHMFGAFQPIVQFNKINKISGNGCDSGATVVAGVTAGTQCDNTEATQVTVALRYILSKRTHTYVSANRITNKDQYNQDFSGAGITSRGGNSFVGADPKLIAVGMIHNF